MIYPENFEQKIGFDKIRELISSRCLSPLGEEKVEGMTFSSQYDLIRKQLYQTHEFTRILQEEDRFPSDYFFDVRDSLKKIRIEGTYLIERELFDIRRSLETINNILNFFCHCGLDPQFELARIDLAQSPATIGGSRVKHGMTDDLRYPHLQELAAEVSSFPNLTKQIDTILDKFGKIKDNASPELGAIRKQLTQTVNGISKTLNSILRSAQSEGLVDKEVTPTMRDGRLVIPISPAFKRKLKGIVHDESATGKTVFIEPAEVVEANNKIRELESEEKREIVRILTAFTNQIRPEVPEILNSYQFLAQIDFIRAKALFGLDIEAILPAMEDRQQIDWIRAIHPLLYLSHRKQNKSVVPLDIELRNEGRILIISGPNAGGKSVLLKTVGLLQYMLQSGLLIPISERSKTGIFKDIFLDIGDEQSIENDLSTYSSHLTNMKFMVKNANPKSLILIDEFGGGTEPQIGGAIAEALLHRFNDKQSFGIITTHYQNLKTYAEDHEGIINGAMLYDRHEMQPLFKLSIGNPGSSFAIEIARKIGLPEDVIAEASEKVGQDYIDMDKYLQDIVRDKRYWESKRQQVRQQEKRLEELSERYQTDLQTVESQRKEIMAKAKADAERLLADANAKIENTIKEIKEAQAEKEKTKEARRTLDDFKQSIQNQDISVIAGLTRNPKKIVKHPSSMNHKKKINDHQGIAGQARNDRKVEGVIQVGDTVRIKGQRTPGEVLEIKGKNIVIAFGALKTSTKLDQLEKVSNNQIRKEASQSQVLLANNSDTMSEKKLNFKPEIDLRGMRGEEALQAVMYYMDDAIQCNAGRVRILHGTGTGALRQIIRDYLKTVPGIKRFQDEHVQFGGTGITVVELE
ncbi:endonuclease MutS2 [Bacteroidia bacterium]|nr:endonuclease MutS2 [Bacteroidia bacterium]